MGAFTPLTGSEQSNLANFLSNGGGLHLTGERPCCEPLNDSLQSLINSVVVGGGITVGDQGDIGGPYVFNPNAVGGITAALTSWNPSASGGMTGLGSLADPSNVLATGAGGVAVGGVWDSPDLVGGAGRLTILMDVNWFSSSGRLDVIDSIQLFNANAAAVPEPSSVALFGMVMGVAGISAVRRRRKSRA